MNESKYMEVVAMLTVIYKKLDKLDRKINGRGTLMASDQTYLDKLKDEAKAVINQINV